MTHWVYDDGGRAAAGFKGTTGDCVPRSIAIVTGLPYQKIYDGLYAATLAHRPTMARLELDYGARARAHASPRTGVPKEITRRYLDSLGWQWVPIMKIGSGCQVHLRADELPSGHIICKVTKHIVAVIDGVIHDTYDCSRNGTRCVYGYYKQSEV